MAERDWESYYPPGEPAASAPLPLPPQDSSTFPMQAEPMLQPNSMLHAYPTSLAYWHNPHILHPVASPSNATVQTPTVSGISQQRKHKRTRSGCYTCRSRRIKCDEVRPVCERCAKGKRDCVYPPAQDQRKPSRSNLKASSKHPSIPENESEDDGRLQDSRTPRSVNEDQLQPHSGLSSRAKSALSRRRSAQSLASKRTRQGTEATSGTQENGSPPSTDYTPATAESLSPETNVDFSGIATESPPQVLSDLPGVSNLKPDVQFFLAYRRQNLTPSHYFLKEYSAKFLTEDLVLRALEYEPLLYAIVGFSAYHYSMGHPNGKLYTFLQYYNRSVSLLLKSLQAGGPHNDSMLLTVLQLMAFEEYLGDWVNLVDHHQAAHRMIVDLYKPDDIGADAFCRDIIMWYTRFDVMAGLLAGNATILGREWYTNFESVARKDVSSSPDDVDKKLFAWNARHRQFAMDMASLFAKLMHGLIGPADFAAENERLTEFLEESIRYLEGMKDPAYLITSFPNKQPVDPGNIVDPYVPGLIYGGPLWEFNSCYVEMIGAKLMYKQQTSMLKEESDFSELRDLALSQCQIIETMLAVADRPIEVLLSFRSTIGFIALFIGQDEKHQMWCRRKLATLESLGYVYPPTFRNKLAGVWKIPEIAHWWLPNDEGYPNIVREIREWTNERVTNPRDDSREAIRDMKSIFRKMTLDDTNSQESSPTALTAPSAPSTEKTPD